MVPTKYAIVCGPQRSGTTQFRQLLHRHPAICIQAEISPPLIPQIHSLVTAADEIYFGTKNEQNYRRKRAEIVSSLFGMFSKAKMLEKGDARVHGFKMPHAEFHYAALNDTVLPSHYELVYFYCIRNVKSVYLSLTAMPWFGMTAKAYFGKYIKSLDSAVRIKNLENPSISVSVLHLDDYIAEDDKASWLMRNIFDVLDVDIDYEQARVYANSTKNTNSAQNRFKTDPPKEFPAQAAKVYRSHKREIVEATSRFNEVFGVDVRNDFDV